MNIKIIAPIPNNEEIIIEEEKCPSVNIPLTYGEKIVCREPPAIHKEKTPPKKRIIPPEMKQLLEILDESTDGKDWIQVVNEKDIVFHKRSVRTI